MSNYTPKLYISWNQMSVFERSKDQYVKQYLLGIKFQTNKYMERGLELADTLNDKAKREEVESELGNDMAMVLLLLPQYKETEKEINVRWMNIPMFGKLDGWNEDTFTLGEVKSGKKWTQKRANEHGQLLFYASMIYALYGKIPNIKLHWAETQEDIIGQVIFTGKVETFDVKYTLKDILRFYTRLKKVYKGISELTLKTFNI